MNVMQDQEVERLGRLRYNVILKHIDDSYFLFIPELSIVVQGADLNETYRKLEDLKRQHFKRLVAMGEQVNVQPPAQNFVSSNILSGSFGFFVRALIVGVVFVMVVVCIHPFLDTIVSNQVKQMPRAALTWAGNLSAKADAKLSGLTPNEADSVRMAIRRRVQVIKPYFDEVRVLWRDSEALQE